MNPSGKIQNNSKLKQQQNYQNRFTMKKNRLFLRILGCIAVLSGAYSAQAQTPGLSYPVPIDSYHFPDAKFREKVAYYDLNNDNHLSETECGNVTYIHVQASSLEGIRYFYALTTLNCAEGYLSSLDVSGLTALTTLDCYSNQLTSLNVSGCTALTSIDCKNWSMYGAHNNRLESLDVSGCTALTELDLAGCSQLTSLDVSDCTALTSLSCSGQLTSLDVSKNTALTSLACSGQLTSLDVSKNTALTSLACSGQLTSLDVSKNTALTSLYCSGNQLTSLDVSKNTALTSLNCSSNQLTSLDVSKNTALTSLNCSSNQLTSLDVSKNTALTSLSCSSNQLTALDLSNNPYFFGSGMALIQVIDVSINDSNRFDLAKAITQGGGDLSRISFLQSGIITPDGNFIFCDTAAYYEYETNSNSAAIYGYSDVEVLPVFLKTSLNNYVVTEINEQNFPDFQFRSFVADNLDGNRNGKIEFLESVRPIRVSLDPYEHQYSLGDYFVPNTSLDISNLGIEDLKGIEFFPYLDSINCSGNNIDSLDLSGLEYLTYLDCSDMAGLAYLEVFDNNQLTSLDCSGTSLDLAFSQYPNLQTLACADMRLTELDLKGCTALTGLDCSGNELVSLDLSGNAALQRLNVNRNRLPALDLSRNTALQEVSTDNNYHLVEADEDRNVYLSTIPGLEADRMDNIQGGSIEGNTLHMEADTLTYYYYYESPSHDAPLGGYFHIALKAEDSPVSIPIDEEHFPDAVFREYIAEADMDADGQLSEIEVSGVTGIDVSGMGIQDLRGIEYFTELESLDCSDNELTSLDLSANAKLQSLNAENNRLDIVLDERDRFDLSQLPGFEMAKASDWTGGTRIGSNLTFKQQEVTYSYATGYNGESEDADMTSVIFSLMADRDPSVGNETSDLQPQGRVYAKNHRICTEGIDTEISIYSASGSLLYRGFDKEIPVRHDGLYLVRSGSRTWKILVL